MTERRSRSLIPLLGHHAHLMLEDQVTTEPASDPNEESGKSGKRKTNGKHRYCGIIPTPVPIRIGHSEHHDRCYEVIPGGGPTANAGDRKHFDGPAKSCEGPHDRTTADQPEGHPGPEGICQKPEGKVAHKGAQKKSDGESYQHGVERMAGHCDNRRRTGARRLRNFFHAHRICSLLFLSPLVAACGIDGPMSTLQPAGPAAEQIANIWWVMLGGSIMILSGVVALALYATYGGRRAQPESLRRWMLVGGGIVFTPFVLLVLLLYGLRSGHALLPLSTDQEVFKVQVIAHQWWWEVRYPGLDGEGTTLYSANEIHVPAGELVDIEVTGADVIHSFWIPRLGGKIDAMPGRFNTIRLEAPHPGLYRGQCAEFCGEQHARMVLLLEAHEKDRLKERLSALREDRPGPEGLAGEEAFNASCAECHSLRGNENSPLPGPNLADLSYRRTLGTGVLPNTPDALRTWIEQHQKLKPGNRMPDHTHLESPTLQAIARYLEQAL